MAEETVFNTLTREDEEGLLVNLANQIAATWELIAAGASCADGGSRFTNERLGQIVAVLQAWEDDVLEWLNEAGYPSGEEAGWEE